ncbi:hypothetical protein T484DRAFT_1753432 [Baffinella frigidus]|nr:hypothetical protein T484DRAFT_1753432 [Cryptophyta sp. CCMP2293]
MADDRELSLQEQSVLPVDRALDYYCCHRRNERGQPSAHDALVFCVVSGNVQTVLDLLSRPRFPLANRTRNGLTTPLHVAVILNRLDIVKILVGVNVYRTSGDILDQVDNLGNTALNVAVQLHRDFRALTRNVTSIDTANHAGRPPLFYAAAANWTRGIKRLYKCGADESADAIGTTNHVAVTELMREVRKARQRAVGVWDRVRLY